MRQNLDSLGAETKMATYSTRGSVAVIEVDNPPVNALRFVTLGLGQGEREGGGGGVTVGVGGRRRAWECGGGGGMDSVCPYIPKEIVLTFCIVPTPGHIFCH